MGVTQGHLNRMQQQVKVFLTLLCCSTFNFETPHLSSFVGKYWHYSSGNQTQFGSGWNEGDGIQDQNQGSMGGDGIFDGVVDMENETNYFIPASTFILNKPFTEIGHNISLLFQQNRLEKVASSTKTPSVILTTESPSFLSKFLSIFQ